MEQARSLAAFASALRLGCCLRGARKPRDPVHDVTMLTARCAQRLHQPHRPLQPPQHVHHPRSRRPRVHNLPVPYQRLLDPPDPQPAAAGMERQEVGLHPESVEDNGQGRRMVLTDRRIIDNTHLLDATEIFRKLNVHKKVSTSARVLPRSDTGLTDRDRNRSPSSASTSSSSSSTCTA